jgi:signal transduction histidine kinase/ligand-binding sensor domain-containing protein
MWFGTSDGLNRYDGYSFTVYRDDPDDPSALQDTFIESLYEDRSGNIWIGTQEGWLEQFDRESGGFIHYQVSSHVYAILQDSKGTFWIGSKDPGLVRFDSSTGETSVEWRGTDFMSIVEDETGLIWAASPEEGLVTYDHTTGQSTLHETDYPTHIVLQDQNGDIWIGTWGGGLGRLERETGQFSYLRNDPDDPSSLSNDYVSSIYEDTAGNLWVGTYQSGLDRYSRQSGQFAHYQHDPSDTHSLSTDTVLSLYQDLSGILWIGHAVRGGISRIPTGVESFGHYRSLPNNPHSLSSDLVTSIHGDQDGVLWIGTFTGIDSWDTHTGEWTNYHHNPDNPDSLVSDAVRSVYVDVDDTLWVGTEEGLDRYDQTRDRFTHYEGPTVMWMHEGPSGAFWLATKDGLFQLDRERDELLLIAEGYAWKIMVLEDRSGIVWVGSSGDGLERYDPASGEWRRYQHDPDDPSSLADDFVESLYEDAEGRLWVATRGGLDLFDRQTDTFAHYGTRQGLAHNGIVGMLADGQGSLWLGTGGGLSRFDPQSETFINYAAGDGLQSDIFWRNAYYQSPDGVLFFGGENGLNAFYPQQIVDNPHAPPIVITAFSVFNQVRCSNLTDGEHIELPYQDSFVSFDFAALDYNAPQQNEYAYILQGLDEEWVIAGTRRHADYPSLRPGEYVFRVVGSNSDGVWNEQGASVHLTIQPPFWSTWWFRAFALLLLAASLVGIYRWRIRSVEARSRKLEEQVAERTAELQLEIEQRLRAEEALRQSEMEKAVAAERSRLARELHDAVTQTLFSASLIAEVLPRMWLVDQERGRQQLEEVRLLTRGALAEMRSLLMELRPEALAKAKMDDLLQQLGRAITGRTGIPVNVSTEGGWTYPATVQIALYRIAQEALNNVAKHAQASRVKIRLDCEPDLVTLSISDDGQGFDLAAIPPDRLGIEIMRERAAAIGAHLDIESRPGAGTQVQVWWAGDRAAEEEILDE